jgi:hypothetical protein
MRRTAQRRPPIALWPGRACRDVPLRPRVHGLATQEKEGSPIQVMRLSPFETSRRRGS